MRRRPQLHQRKPFRNVARAPERDADAHQAGVLRFFPSQLQQITGGFTATGATIQHLFEVVAVVFAEVAGEVERRQRLIVELDRRAVKLGNLHHEIFDVFPGDVFGQIVQPDFLRKSDDVDDTLDPQGLLDSVVSVVAQSHGKSLEHGKPPSWRLSLARNHAPEQHGRQAKNDESNR